MCGLNPFPKSTWTWRDDNNLTSFIYLYILRGFTKLVITFYPIKNTSKLINQQLKNEVKIVNWKKKVSYYFFNCQKYPYLKLKNWVKIVNWQK